MDRFIKSRQAEQQAEQQAKQQAEPAVIKKSRTSEKYQLPSPSQEQNIIINDVKQKKCNVVVNSVFGSGKTTTILHIAKANPDDNILILTYNARLKTECREKAQSLGFSHCEIHSYHAIGVKYYSYSCRTDTELQNILKRGDTPRKAFRFSLIVMDEQQDMSPLYYSWILKVLKDNTFPNPRLVVFGDIYQNIYGYRGGDARFLTWSPSLFLEHSHYPWNRRNITTSFRVSYPTANFINRHLLHYDRVRTSPRHQGKAPVRYLITDAFSTTPFEEVLYYLRNGCQPQDIYILAPSLRVSKHLSPVRRLENRLVQRGLPCFVPISDDEVIGEEVSHGKIVFSSFHQIKGSERPVVIVFNFDASYFDFYAKQEPRDQCPNAIYVAVSRAKSQMSLIHHYENDMFPTIREEELRRDRLVDWQQDKSWCNGQQRREKKRRKKQDLSVSNLLRHLHENILDHALGFFMVESVQPSGNSLRFSSTTTSKTTNYIENVAEITGVAIPALFEIEQTGGRCSVLSYVRRHLEQLPLEHADRVIKLINNLSQTKNIEIEDMLYLSNVFLSLGSGYIYKREQITDYQWVSSKMALKAKKRVAKLMNHVFGEQEAHLLFEQEAEREIGDKNIVGRIDILSPDSLFEIKVTDSIEKTHQLQAILYAWLTRTTKRNIYVYNIKTDECLKIQANQGLSLSEALDECVHYLIKQKYKPQHLLSDEAFQKLVQECQLGQFAKSNSQKKMYEDKRQLEAPRKAPVSLFISDSDDD